MNFFRPRWRRLSGRKEIVVKLNENAIAREIAKREGKKKQVNIGQIKEVQRQLLRILAEKDEDAVLILIRKHRPPKR